MIHLMTRQVFTLFDPFDSLDRDDVVRDFKEHESYNKDKLYIVHWDYPSAYWTVYEIEQI